MRKITIMIALLILLIFTIDKIGEQVNFDSPIYSGSELTVGIVGDRPEVREKNITFIQLSMEDILKESRTWIVCLSRRIT